MKSIKYKEKRKFVKEEKRIEKKHIVIIIILALTGIIYHYFFEPVTIGHDTKYTVFVFILPTTIGVLSLGIYRKKFLINRFSINKGFILWAFMIFFYLLQGIIFSYLSFGQVANITWNLVNENMAKQNQKETFTCEVNKFLASRKSNEIGFIFNDRYESIHVSYDVVKEYLNKDPKNYELLIQGQKGLWNHYLLTNWEIIEK